MGRRACLSATYSAICWRRDVIGATVGTVPRLSRSRIARMMQPCETPLAARQRATGGRAGRLEDSKRHRIAERRCSLSLRSGVFAGRRIGADEGRNGKWTADGFTDAQRLEALMSSGFLAKG